MWPAQNATRRILCFVEVIIRPPRSVEPPDASYFGESSENHGKHWNWYVTSLFCIEVLPVGDSARGGGQDENEDANRPTRGFAVRDGGAPPLSSSRLSLTVSRTHVSRRGHQDDQDDQDHQDHQDDQDHQDEQSGTWQLPRTEQRRVQCRMRWTRS